MNWMKHLYYGKWSFGYEYWNGKPKLYVGRAYYDGWLYVLHLGKLWIECDY